MAEITAALVKELRERTGAGMMDCKKALNEADGDIEAAIDWLRKKGLAAAAKKSGRVAAEGLVGVASAPGRAAMVEVNAETDFVARNETFQAFVATVAERRPRRSARTSRRSSAAPLSRHRAHRRGRADPPGRHHRREHEPPPRPGAARGQGVVATYVHNARQARPRQDRRAGGRRGRRRTGGAGDARPADRHARRRGEAGGARHRRGRPGGAGAREGGAVASRPAPPASRKRSSRRWSKAASASTTRKWCCWSRSGCMTARAG